MNLNIEIPDEFAAALKAQAQAQGVSPGRFISRIVQSSLEANVARQPAGQPLKTGRGMLAKYGPAPSAEEIDENRSEMFRNFAQDF